MDLKVAVLFLYLCALAILPTEGGIPKCCVRTSKKIPLSMLKKVERVEVQRDNGVCNIKALVLFVNGKRLCAHPRVKNILKNIQKRREGGKKKRSS